VSRDDAHVLTSCRRGRLYLWDLETGRSKWMSALHDGTKYQMHFPAFLPNGEQAVTGYSHVYNWDDAGQTLRLWDLRTGKVTRSYRFKVGVSSLVPFSDNRRVALLMEDGPLKIFDLKTGKVLRTIDNQTTAEGVSSLALSPNEQSVVAPTAVFYAQSSFRHSREGGNPSAQKGLLTVQRDPHLRGDDGTRNRVRWTCAKGSPPSWG
jgi:WD40 repeat protein